MPLAASQIPNRVLRAGCFKKSDFPPFSNTPCDQKSYRRFSSGDYGVNREDALLKVC